MASRNAKTLKRWFTPILAKMSAQISVNLLLVMGWVWLDWTLVELVMILWVELVVLMAVGLPVYIVLAHSNIEERSAALTLHAIMALGLGLTVWTLTAEVDTRFDFSAGVGVSPVLIAALVILHECLAGRAQRRHADTDTTGLVLMGTMNRTLKDLIPLIVAIAMGLSALGSGESASNVYMLIVATKFTFSVFMAFLLGDLHTEPPAPVSCDEEPD